MKPILPRWTEPYAFGLMLTMMMSLVVSGIATLLNVGPVAGFLAFWMKAWLPSWAIAFPTVLIAAPAARRILRSLVKSA